MYVPPTNEVLQNYPVPFTPRKDQFETIDTLCQWGRSGCYYPVGGGKTFISTAVGLWYGLHDLIDQILVLCPPILLLQWVAWLQSLGLDVCKYYASPAVRKKLSLAADCIVTTPGMFKNDYERFLEYFVPRRVFMIVDEAVVIRQAGTLAHKAVRGFVENPDKYLMLLTGTEISAPFQAYGYIKLITPDVYRDYRYFTMVHVTKLDQYKTPCEYRKLDVLAKAMLLQAVRKEADDIMDLPDVNFIPITYDLSPEHLKLYKKVVEEKLVTLDDGAILNGLLPQNMRMTCQRVIMMPSEFEGHSIVPAGFQFIDEMMSELGKEKLMVFGQFHTSNEAIYDYCEKQGYKPALVYGGDRRTLAKNQKELARFMGDPECRILTGNPKSCGIGVDGIQHVCRAQLFLELPPFSDFDQTVGRIKREGQKRKCIVRIAIANKTVQVDLARRATKKEALARQVVPTKATLRAALMGE